MDFFSFKCTFLVCLGSGISHGQVRTGELRKVVTQQCYSISISSEGIFLLCSYESAYCAYFLGVSSNSYSHQKISNKNSFAFSAIIQMAMQRSHSMRVGPNRRTYWPAPTHRHATRKPELVIRNLEFRTFIVMWSAYKLITIYHMTFEPPWTGINQTQV